MRATNEKCEYSEEKEKRREEEIEEETLSPGAPPAPVRLSGQKNFEEKFSPLKGQEELQGIILVRIIIILVRIIIILVRII